MEIKTRAVVFATRFDSSFSNGRCGGLTPLIDRPFLQHVIECLIERGIKSIDLIVHDQAAEIESYFENGVRWGGDFRYHLVLDPERPYRSLKRLKLGAHEQLLLVHGDKLNPEGWQEAIETSSTSGSPTLFLEPLESSTSETDRWTGAALLSSTFLRSETLQNGFENFAETLVEEALKNGHLVSVRKPLSACTFGELVASQGRVLSGEFPDLLRSKTQAEPGIWIGRNVYIHPSIQIEAPVFIGNNVEINADVRLGPNAVISDGTLLNPHCEIKRSFIAKDSLVGEGLDVDHCVLDRHRLYHIDHDVSVSVHDELLMGTTKIAMPGARAIRRIFSRLIAILFLIAFAPLMVATFLIQKMRYGNAVEVQESLKLPHDGEPHSAKTFRLYRFANKPGGGNLKHFFCEFLPGLINIAKGDIGWVGVVAITRSELNAMPEEWRTSFLDSECGLINESTVLYGRGGNREEILSAEIYYVVTVNSFWARLKRILSYFASVVFGPRARSDSKISLPDFNPKAMFPYSDAKQINGN